MWQDKEDNPAEVDKLENGPYMQRVLDRMSWRLGFNVTRGEFLSSSVSMLREDSH